MDYKKTAIIGATVFATSMLYRCKSVDDASYYSKKILFEKTNRKILKQRVCGRVKTVASTVTLLSKMNLSKVSSSNFIFLHSLRVIKGKSVSS